MEMKSIVLDIKNNAVYDGPTTEIAEDMPDFDEITAETPCEGEESVDKCTDDAENAILSEENPDDSSDTEGETEEKEDDEEEDTAGSTEKKEDTKPKSGGFKSNLPVGFSFNPLVIAIKPFYEKLIADDEIFAKVVRERESRAEKPKSLSECADYIMSEAYDYASKHRQGSSGMAGFPDDDMYRLIRHYYDEEFLEVHKFTGARASFAKTTAKKTEEKPKPVKNVVDITKAIVSSTKPKEEGKKAKREKKKDNLNAGFVPMERPETYEEYAKEARKGSREQAKSVETIDMFADFFANEE